MGDSLHLYDDESKNLVSSIFFYSLDSKFCYRYTLICKLNKEIRMIEFYMHREVVIKLPLHLLIMLTVSFGLE